MNKQELASHLDLANHHGNATPMDIEKLCNTVVANGFNGAFINPVYIALAKQHLSGKAKVGTAFSFPLGQDTLDSKVYIATKAVTDGVDELDAVPNNGLLVAGLLDEYKKELQTIVKGARSVRKDIIVKFILETGYLSEEQIKTGALAIVEAGADFVKICSGMGPRGASIEDVKIVRATIGDRAHIKVAGGVDTLEEALGFLSAGANRIGTSSAVKIIEEFRATSG